MFIAKTLSFYKQANVQRALVEQARDKEVSVKFQTFFGKRPETLYTEGDVLDFAKKKASSFHCSEELWTNPLHIKTGMSQNELKDLRKGWDLILDIDCPYWQLSKLITHLFIKALEAHDMKSVSSKYSGNKGFHIAVPFEAFPETFQGQDTKDLFPEAPRRIAYYLLDYLAKHYVEAQGDYFVFDKQYKISKEKLAKALGKGVKDFAAARGEDHEQRIHLLCRSCGYITRTTERKDTYVCPVCNGIMQEERMQQRREERTDRFDPLTIIDVDTILIAHRHLYRMPYSFHEKSELISVPVENCKVLSFKKSQARPENVDFSVPFLERDATPGEATKLLVAAYDFDPQLEEEKEKKTFAVPEEAVPEKFFPPCIRAILQGLKDGRKRSMFTLINFLRGCGWGFEQIEEALHEWNQRNEEPLREVELKSRLRYEKNKREAAPPHNCKRYYQDFGVCHPDEFCNRIKNPLQYAKLKAARGGHGKKRRGLTEEQRAARRKYREKKKKQRTS
ncbi:hypothetical protein GF367_02715 [Candidatus Woesearchaeota archaeon]|nr:hypothetical protein [Candidatus Woesearchaeota archaeon]